jgi:hypothetical protein
VSTKVLIFALAVTSITTSGLPAQPVPQPSKGTEGKPVPVTADNFIRAETDVNFGFMVKDGALGKFIHHRDLSPIDNPIVRPNRDTLYSMSVFDLDAGPVTVTLPDPGNRFLSLQVIDQNHYSQTLYGGKHTFTLEKIGTRYVGLGVRILVDPNDQADLKQVHALQDAIKVEQPRGPGKWEVPNWDMAGRKKVRDALLILNETLPDSRRMFGARGEVDPVRHLIGTAMGFGGNPEKDALYLPITPPKNDGKAVYRLTVKDVPVDGFWSVSVYNADGRFVKNEYYAYTVNNITAKNNEDGSVTIQFGGDASAAPNVLPITPGWNYLVRLYRPRKEILDGTWRFPEVQPVNGEQGNPMLNGS